MQSDLAQRALEQDLKTGGGKQEPAPASGSDLRVAADEAWDAFKADDKEGFARAFEAAVRIGRARG